MTGSGEYRPELASHQSRAENADTHTFTSCCAVEEGKDFLPPVDR
jgi:hypothetical protein